MPAFEFPNHVLIAYGKTGSTSLTKLAETTGESEFPHLIRHSNGHVWEPTLGVDYENLPDKPVYLVMRSPLDRLISGIQMFLMVRYCDNMIVESDLSYKWADMMPEPNPYKAHFLRTLKELWSSEEFWITQIPIILTFFRSELFDQDSKIQEYLRSEPGGQTPEQADARFAELLSNFGFPIALDQHAVYGDFHQNWQDLMTNRLMEERYHIGNYLTYIPTDKLSGWIHLKNLSVWSRQHSVPGMIGHSISKENSNQTRGFHIAPGSLWSATEESAIITAMRQGLQKCSLWWLFERYLTTENIAYQDIQTRVPEVGLEPAATENRSINKHRSSND